MKNNDINFLDSNIIVDYPDYKCKNESVKSKFENLPTKVNLFRMLGHSPGTFIELMDLTDAIFKKLTLSDYHKELVVLQLSAYDESDYEWDQHVRIGEASGVSKEQILSIAQHNFFDDNIFSASEQILLNLSYFILTTGKTPAPIFKQALNHFSIEELSDTIITIGFYRMLSYFIKTFNIPIDAQEDGNWTKK